MAKLTDRTALVTPADGDFYVTTDISDTTDGATGTDKKITWANIKAALATVFASKVGTPVNNQVGIWTGDGTIEGDAALTFDTATDTVTIGVEAGDPAIVGKDATSSNTAGANAAFGGGAGNGSGAGGGGVIFGGSGGATGGGGTAGVSGGNGGATSGNGGTVYMSAGESTSGNGGDANINAGNSNGGGGNGGSVIVTAGLKNGAGTDGVIELASQTKVTVGLAPDANDGAYLGTSALGFSDLFLAEGGVINWDNGDATLTQVGDVVTLAGADLKVTTPGTASTSVATIDGTQTLTNKTIGTGATVVAGYFDLDSPASDHTAVGPCTNAFASGYTAAQFDLVFMGSGGKWLEVDADAVATCKGMIGLTLEAKNDTEAMLVALPGSFVRDDTWAWTVGATLYAGETLGAMQEAIPTGADAVIKVVGFAVSADVIFFNPSPDQQTTVA